MILPHRKTLLEGETSAAMVDDIIRRGMKAEGLLDPGQDCDLSDFLVRWRFVQSVKQMADINFSVRMFCNEHLRRQA